MHAIYYFYQNVRILVDKSCFTSIFSDQRVNRSFVTFRNASVFIFTFLFPVREVERKMRILERANCCFMQLYLNSESTKSKQNYNELIDI